MRTRPSRKKRVPSLEARSESTFKFLRVPVAILVIDLRFQVVYIFKCLRCMMPPNNVKDIY